MASALRASCLFVSLLVHFADGGRMWAGDAEEIVEGEDPQATETGLDPIDWNQMKQMKKSKIWQFVEEREQILKDTQAELRSRTKKHSKESAAVSRDWRAVKSKFDALHAEQAADKKEIQGLEGDAKAQKNDIRKLKSIVYKMR